MRQDRRLDADPARPDRGNELRPRLGKVSRPVDDAAVADLALGLDPVARIGQHDDVLEAHDELAGRPGDLLLTVGQREAGEIARVLGPQAEVRIDPSRLEPGSQSRQPDRARGAIGLGPAPMIRSRRRRREVRRLRQPFRRWTPAHFGPYFAMFALCSANVFA